MTLQREKQRVASTEVLQALANGEEIRLDGCTISGDLDVARLFVKEENFDVSAVQAAAAEGGRVVTFSQAIVFNSCVFEGNLCVAGPWDRPADVKAVFERDVSFNSSVFHGQAHFGGAVFKGATGFDGCVFRRVVSFRRAAFGGRAMFRTVLFEGYGLFNTAVFAGEVRFTNTCFSKGGNFTDVRFDGPTDFGGCYSGSKAVPITDGVYFARRRYGDDESFWRFVKQSCTEGGYYQLAGESFYSERCANFWRRFRGAGYNELSGLRKLGRILAGTRLLPELVFGRWLFGYGERPIRVLLASVLIIVLCALFYSSPRAAVSYRSDEHSQRLDLMDGLYFSTITFTTLGFGDMYPARTDRLTKSIAMAEALSGACLMALFVVCLSKRFSRG
jgi:hypothetical protein